MLNEAEKAEMIASLKEAEAQIEAGHCTGHDPASFLQRLKDIRNRAKLATANSPAAANSPASVE